MKLAISLKLILLVVHLSDSMEANRLSVTRVFDDYKLGHRERNVNSTALLNIVLVAVSNGGHKEEDHKVCTGTLIRDDMVITLASCLLLYVREGPFTEFTSVYERPSGTILDALKIYIHPNFYSEDRSVSRLHDFGLIMVEKSQQKDYPQLPQQLDDFKVIQDTCVMGGYGTNTSNTNVDQFRMYEMSNIKVNLVEGIACLTGVCLHFTDIMPCEADFGSPMICGGVLYALYTPRFSGYIGHFRGLFERHPRPKCLDFYITAFSPLYNIKDWVKQIKESSTSNLEWLNNPWYVLLVCCVVFIFMGGIYYGLVEVLQRTFDPSEVLQMGATRRSTSEDGSKDDDSWN